MNYGLGWQMEMSLNLMEKDLIKNFKKNPNAEQCK